MKDFSKIDVRRQILSLNQIDALNIFRPVT